MQVVTSLITDLNSLLILRVHVKKFAENGIYTYLLILEHFQKSAFTAYNTEIYLISWWGILLKSTASAPEN